MNTRFGRRGQRAPASGRILTAQDAAIVKGMLARGDRQHDVAAYFGVNSARIAEIANGDKFPNMVPEDLGKLPQPLDPRLYRLAVGTDCNIESDGDLFLKLIQMRNRLDQLISITENRSR